MNFFRKKTFESIKELESKSKLNKNLNALDLILLGLGAIIGTGVFVTTGIVAAKYSGPAVMISYAIAGIICIFVALAYTELATMLPTSGSIYTYSYVAFGEIFAWLMGSVIILELGFAAGVVAAGWSGYIQAILNACNLYIPDNLSKVPSDGGIINLPAFLIVMFVFCILFLGTKDSKKLNATLVFIKVGAIGAFAICATPHFDTINWKNFLPFGYNNMLIGASILFFAFTGFGSIAATAEECTNPNKDLMIGIVGSLIISIVIYVIIGGLVTGIVSFKTLNNDQPLAYALNLNKNTIGSTIVATGAVCGMTTVLMMQIYATSRIFYVIARDGLLPKSFAKLHPKYDSPYITILIFSFVAAVLGGFCPTSLLVQLSSMGSLIDYLVITLIVVLFRIKKPEVYRPFKCPMIFLTAPVVLIACTYLLAIQIFDKHFNLLLSGKALIIWFLLILILYILRLSFINRRNKNA